MRTRKPPAIVIGERFGRLVVISLAEKRSNTIHWNCHCDCGGDVAVTPYRLRSGNTRSCGCLVKDTRFQTHGHTKGVKAGGRKSATYRTWQAMRNRCHYPRDRKYSLYGARGISVCKAWRDSFEAFLNDMGERPQGHTIDRIDNRFGYFPANCRWTTPKQQAANQTHGGPETRYKDWPKLAALIASSPFRHARDLSLNRHSTK